MTKEHPGERMYQLSLPIAAELREHPVDGRRYLMTALIHHLMPEYGGTLDERCDMLVQALWDTVQQYPMHVEDIHDRMIAAVQRHREAFKAAERRADAWRWLDEQWRREHPN